MSAEGLEAVVAGLGLIGTLCFALLLGPQVLLNARRRSTAGLELSLVLLWHIGSIIYGASLLVEEASPWLLGSMACFCVLSAILEAQEAVYAHSSPIPIALWTIGVSALSVGAVYVLAIPLRTLSPPVRVTLGDGLPAAFFAAGFVPQLHAFVCTRSVEGYSFGVTALDVVGSAANCGVLLLSPHEVGSPPFWVVAMPFFVIISLHGVLILVACYIFTFHPQEGKLPLSDHLLSVHEEASTSPDCQRGDKRAHASGTRRDDPVYL